VWQAVVRERNLPLEMKSNVTQRRISVKVTREPSAARKQRSMNGGAAGMKKILLVDEREQEIRNIPLVMKAMPDSSKGNIVMLSVTTSS
jgi:hypothetical protein